MVVAALLLAFAVQNVIEMRQESATSDEIVKLTGGYTNLLKRDFRLNTLHPPLLKMISALPLLALHPKIDFTDPAWQKPPNQWKFSSHFLYSNNAARLLFWSRIPMVLLALLLGFFIFRWAQRLYGSVAGLFALTLYSFSPNFIAHSHLFTLDTGSTAFLTISFYFLWSHSRSGSRLTLLWSTLFMGAALTSKYLSVAMLPSFAFLLWLIHRRDFPAEDLSGSLGAKKSGLAGSRGKRKGGQSGKAPEKSRVAGPGGKSSASRQGTKILRLSFFICLGIIGVLGLLAYLKVPVVRSMWEGLTEVTGYGRTHFPFYWHGSFVEGGAWYFFLGTFLVKSTAGLLILTLVRFIVFLKKWRSEWRDSLFLIVPAILYFVFVSGFANPIGVRYLLPSYALLMIFASGVVRNFARQRLAFWTVWLLLGWHVVSSLAAFPHSLSYFNEFAGGPSHGTDWLDDSNVDWGQELKNLKTVLNEHHITDVALISFSSYDNPEYYGIRCSRPRQADWPELFANPQPGFYAISAHWLARAKGSGLDWKLRFPIVANIGNSMFVFQVR
jgi:hypothetical protein